MNQLSSEIEDMIKEDWKPIEIAPKDGRTIEFNYGTEQEPETALVFWSNKPVCMGGPTVYIKPGWATAAEGNTDTNLPMDAAEFWRNY